MFVDNFVQYFELICEQCVKKQFKQMVWIPVWVKKEQIPGLYIRNTFKARNEI